MLAWALAAIGLAFVLIQYRPWSLSTALGVAGLTVCLLPRSGMVAVAVLGGVALLLWRFAARGLGEEDPVLRRLEGPGLYLTFDDGPCPDSTPRILDLLRKHGAAATFFVVGEKAARHADLVRRMQAEGHVVGLHGWGHQPYPWLSPAALRLDLDRQCDLLGSILGRPPRWLRPPWGLHHRLLRQEAARRRLALALWTRSTRDWTRPGASSIARRIVSAAQPGAVLLLHDASHDGRRSAAQTVEALGLALQELSRLGVRCAALPEGGTAGFEESPDDGFDPGGG